MSIALDLSGHRLLVVGASSGIGETVGRMACAAGARVAFAARRRDRLEAIVDEAGGAALALACDVREAADCARAVAETTDAFGGLDGLVYATGRSSLGLLEEVSQDEWRDILDVNVVGASLVTAAAVPALRAHHGRAVYISSYSVRQPLPGLALYRVSKVALDALIECWRMEHPDVDFTRVVLGNTVGTEFAAAWDPDRLRTTLETWKARNLFPAPTMMSREAAAESILSVLAVRGYLDDIAIMPRMRDAEAGEEF